MAYRTGLSRRALALQEREEADQHWRQAEREAARRRWQLEQAGQQLAELAREGA